MSTAKHAKFFSLSMSLSLKSLGLVLLFSAVAWVLILRLQINSIEEVVSNKISTDLHQFVQLRESAYATQLNFMETLPLLLPQQAMEAKQLANKLNENWPTLSLLNDVESFILFDTHNQRVASLGYGSDEFEISQEELNQVRSTFLPLQKLHCASECHFFAIAPIISPGFEHYIAAASIPVELVIYELAWLSDVDVAVVDQHFQVIANVKEHTHFDNILSQLKTTKKRRGSPSPLLGQLQMTMTTVQNDEYPLHTYQHDQQLDAYGIFPIDLEQPDNQYKLILARNITPHIEKAEYVLTNMAFAFLSGALVFTIVSIVSFRNQTRRVSRLSKALPSLAGHQFSRVRDILGKPTKQHHAINEIDQLETATHQLTDQLEEITAELLQQRQDLHSMAYKDSLTGLPNRQSFYEQLEKEVNALSRSSYALGLLFIDLDEFKQINDTYGHHTGDHILIGLANRTSQCIRKTDYLFRLAGDEFVIIATHLQSVDGLETTAEKILHVFKEPLVIEDHAFTLSLSIGGTLTWDDEIKSDELLHCADEAMYVAKKQGKGQYSFKDNQGTSETKLNTPISGK